MHPLADVEFRSPSAQSGLTLVELLVVVGILGILASVAIAQYATYKQKAVDTDMLSTLREARHAMEALYVGQQSYAAATEAGLPAYGYRSSPAVSLKIVSKTVETYILRVCAVGGTSAAMIYDSSLGTSDPDSGSCS